MRTAVVLSHARGVILLAAEVAGVQIAEYSPALIKKTVVGRGAALKPQVGYMVAQLLRLKSAPTPDDAADGVAVALTHLIVATRKAVLSPDRGRRMIAAVTGVVAERSRRDARNPDRRRSRLCGHSIRWAWRSGCRRGGRG